MGLPTQDLKEPIFGLYEKIDFKKGTKFTDSSADTKAYTAYDTKAKTYRHKTL
jgi:hypothetical protein